MEGFWDYFCAGVMSTVHYITSNSDIFWWTLSVCWLMNQSASSSQCYRTTLEDISGFQDINAKTGPSKWIPAFLCFLFLSSFFYTLFCFTSRTLFYIILFSLISVLSKVERKQAVCSCLRWKEPLTDIRRRYTRSSGVCPRRLPLPSPGTLTDMSLNHTLMSLSGQSPQSQRPHIQTAQPTCSRGPIHDGWSGVIASAFP